MTEKVQLQQKLAPQVGVQERHYSNQKDNLINLFF